jgi:multisubunit Na+/H+ antiporter MnhG subunit
MLFVARIIKLVAGLVAAVIVLGILLFVLGANQSNALVEVVMDAGRWLTTPFHGLFNIDNRKTELAVNWGLAAAVYYVVASFVARLLARGSLEASRRRRERWRWRRGAAA